MKLGKCNKCMYEENGECVWGPPSIKGDDGMAEYPTVIIAGRSQRACHKFEYKS